jgi:polyhydroxyalkanoate synthesis regulator phasin
MGEDSAEDKILNKQVSFSVKDMKWVITTAVSVVLWIVTAILWVKDSNARGEKIQHLEEQNTTLEKQVATLEGQIEGVQNASNIFMQNPPGELKFRIDILEKRIDILEKPGSNIPFDNSEALSDTTRIIRRGH